jgi:hypothetical protein
MNLPAPTHIDTIKTRSMSQSTQAKVLSDIYHEEHNLAIWQRTLPPTLLTAIDAFLLSNSTFSCTLAVTPDNALSTVKEALKSAENSVECADALSKDIAELVDMFCCLFDLKQAGLRLTALTYQGIATEWLPHDRVNRAALGGYRNEMSDEQSGIYQQTEDIHQLQRGDVALLKGERWEGNENAGLVHRSPSLMPNEKRLLLTLDFLA